MFDPQTGLPARIRTLDYDNMWGDVNYDLVLSDWTNMGGIRVRRQQKYELNGRVIHEVRLTEVNVNSPVHRKRLRAARRAQERGRETGERKRSRISGSCAASSSALTWIPTT